MARRGADCGAARCGGSGGDCVLAGAGLAGGGAVLVRGSGGEKRRGFSGGERGKARQNAERFTSRDQPRAAPVRSPETLTGGGCAAKARSEESERGGKRTSSLSEPDLSTVPDLSRPARVYDF